MIDTMAKHKPMPNVKCEFDMHNELRPMPQVSDAATIDPLFFCVCDVHQPKTRFFYLFTFNSIQQISRPRPPRMAPNHRTIRYFR